MKARTIIILIVIAALAGTGFLFYKYRTQITSLTTTLNQERLVYSVLASQADANAKAADEKYRALEQLQQEKVDATIKEYNAKVVQANARAAALDAQLGRVRRTLDNYAADDAARSRPANESEALAQLDAATTQARAFRVLYGRCATEYAGLGRLLDQVVPIAAGLQSYARTVSPTTTPAGD